MSTRARVTHTPCGQPIDLSDSNRILEPDTDIEHRCPVTNGPTTVVRHGTRWTVEHILDPTQKQPLYATRAQAQTEADQRNRAYAHAHQPRPQQTGLFDQQETA
jgi:hypothetical protein